MIERPLDAITIVDIHHLLESAQSERHTLEYKESLPTNSDKDKKEFLSDVASFANSQGGDIVFGVAELRDEDGHPTGIPSHICSLPTVNLEAETLRLEQMCRDGLAPRIQGLRFRAVEASDTRIIVLRIPQSWNRPHMLTFSSSSRFHARTSAGKYPLDVGEIRAAFALSDALPQRMRSYREERVSRLMVGDTPVPLTDSAMIVLHILPVASFTGTASVGVTGIQPTALPPMYANSWKYRLNFDGCLTFEPSGHGATSYVQLFRNGIIEAVDSGMLAPVVAHESTIPSRLYEEELIQALAAYQRVLISEDIRPPWFVTVSLVGVKGFRMGVRKGLRDTHYEIDRPVLLVPEQMIEEVPFDSSRILHPAFDAVWQSVGIARSLNFDGDGAWIGQR